MAAIGNRSLDMAPHGVFPCRGDDRWIALAVADDLAWRALLGVAGGPERLAEARFATLRGRLEHQDALDAALAEWTSAQASGAVLALVNFPAHAQPGHVPQAMLDKLGWSYTLSLLGLYLVALVLLCGYNISRASHTAALKTLAERRGSA